MTTNEEAKGATMSETKRWECCGVDWSEQVAMAGEYAFCPRCGKRFPAPDAAPSEDERLAWELDNLHWHIVRAPDAERDLTPFREWTTECKTSSLTFLAKACELLEPAAYDRGKQDGRREAYEATIAECERRAIGHAAISERPVAYRGIKWWATVQRDACGPEKAERSADDGMSDEEFNDVVLDKPGSVGDTEEADAMHASGCGPITWAGMSEKDQERWRSVVRPLRSRESALRAENERLKEQVTAARAQANGQKCRQDETVKERNELRAKLAEAERVLSVHSGQGEAIRKILAPVIGDTNEPAVLTPAGLAEKAARILREQKAEIARFSAEIEHACERADKLHDEDAATIARLTRELEGARKHWHTGIVSLGEAVEVNTNLGHGEPRWEKQNADDVWGVVRLSPHQGSPGFTTDRNWNCHAEEEGKRWRRISPNPQPATVPASKPATIELQNARVDFNEQAQIIGKWKSDFPNRTDYLALVGSALTAQHRIDMAAAARDQAAAVKERDERIAELRRLAKEYPHTFHFVAKVRELLSIDNPAEKPEEKGAKP